MTPKVAGSPNLLAGAAIVVAMLAAVLAGPGAWAQVPNFLGMDLNQQNQMFNQQMNAAMAQRQNQIVQQNLNDPRVMQAYRMGVCGPGLTPQQFAYKWAATGGCTPQGYANYNATTQMNAAREAAAMQRYREAQAARSQAMAQQQQGFSNNQYQAGMQLNGWRYTTLPDGRVYWYRP